MGGRVGENIRGRSDSTSPSLAALAGRVEGEQRLRGGFLGARAANCVVLNLSGCSHQQISAARKTTLYFHAPDWARALMAGMIWASARARWLSTDFTALPNSPNVR
jgi:hypothetical protein